MAKQSRFTLRFPQIAARIFNTPLLVEPGKMNAILSMLGPRMGFELEGEVDPAFMQYANEDFRHVEYMAQLESQGMTSKLVEDGGYYLVNGETALIPVIGTLVQRSDMMDEMSGMTSYGKVQRKFDAAMADRKVKQIVLEMDTPGGEVAGAFDFADHIYNSRGDKKIIAVAAEKAASAGYLIASAADDVVLPRTGNVGSIGVVATHHDMGRALEKKGIAVTLLYAGEKKVDGHPYGPLDERVTEEWMSEIREVYDLFVNTVSRNMDISADRVRGTEAGVYMGSKAVDAGLAHRVNTLSNELINSTLRSGGRLNDRLRATEVTQLKENEMSDKDKTATAEDVTRARAEGKTEGVAEASATHAAALRTAQTEATTGERGRIKAILTHAEATGRGTLAQHLAFNTEMTAEQAGDMLKNSPKETAAEPKTPLARAMEQRGPGIPSQDTETDTVTATTAVNPTRIYEQRAKQADSYRR